MRHKHFRGEGATLNSNTKGFYRSLNLKNIFNFVKPNNECNCEPTAHCHPEEEMKSGIAEKHYSGSHDEKEMLNNGKSFYPQRPVLQHDIRRNAAFTLAETMIVIVVLGIIATLTIPALVNKNKESVAKTKLRKAMAAYESAINKMIIENDLKSDTALTEWGNITNCTNSTNYFKKSKDINGCIFKTTDGIWWNISDITRPVISFKEITTQNEEQITANANNENDKTAFVLVGRFGNDGSLRVDDLAYETSNSIADAHGNESKAQVEKLYTLLGMKKAGNSAGGNTTQSPFAACNGAETCVVDGITYTKMTLTAESHTYGYCDPEDFDLDEGMCGENDDKWKTGTSESNAEDYYVAIVGYPSDYDEQAHDLTGSICSSYCVNGYEYYNAAKRHCSSGSLATIAQLKSLKNQGKLPSGYFWASEEMFQGSAYIMDQYGFINSSDKDDRAQVICIGQ